MEEPVHRAAHTDAAYVQEPNDDNHWHKPQAPEGSQDTAQTATEQTRDSPVDSIHSAHGKSPKNDMPPPPKPQGQVASSDNKSKLDEVMGVAQCVTPKLPAAVVISLPIGLEDGSFVQTQSFPCDPCASPPVVTRLIPSITSPQHEESDCDTVANPWFDPLCGSHAKPETATRSSYSGSIKCPPEDDRNNTTIPENAAETPAPAAARTTSSLHTPEESTNACMPHQPSEGQQSVTSKASATTVSEEETTAPTCDLNGTSPETVCTVEEVDTPREESMPTQTRSKAPPLSQTPEPAADGAALAPGLYGRERNQKRAATKAYRQPVTPRALRSADNKKAAERASSPTAVATNKPKRAAPSDEGPDQKRRRLSSTAASTRSRRATHPVDVEERKSQEPQQTYRAEPEQSAASQRPLRDVEGDRQYVAQLQEILEVRGKARKADMGKRQAMRIHDLLDLATYSSVEEALFLTREEATEAVGSGKFFNGPIITEGQQALPLQTVSEFCDEYYDDDTMVWIQDPEIRPSQKAQIARQVKMAQVKERLAGPASDKPWNCLELATHSDDGLKPSFLNTEDCRLLTKLKIPDTQDKPEARRRAYLPGYKEVEKWALLAQAGALTEPHQDSHGYSTYITINEGHVGFGWLSFPSDEERAAWRRNPAVFRGGRWRYVILKPGQTVYFPAGTVHMVFRLPSGGNTLAFGGHVLRCSNIVHWVKTLIEERDAKDVTNEDLTESAPGYLAKVEKFVKQARITGQEAKWGGEESIKEFLRLKEAFLKRKQK